MKKTQSAKAQIEALLAEIEGMEAGGKFGKLEELFEKRFKEVKVQTLHEAIQRRSQAAAKADFPPSGVSNL